MSDFLEAHKVRAHIGHKEILKGVTLSIGQGETHVLMGPNGSGKSTFAHVLMGNPRYAITSGSIRFRGEEITRLAPEERAKKGLFMAFQYPREISGVQLDRFLYLAYTNIRKEKKSHAPFLDVFDFRKILEKEMDTLHMSREFAERSVNQGFSGGEKKKAEMLQLAMLDPDFAVLDETDSGLDVDALKIVGEAVQRFRNPEKSVLLVTHYQRILQYVRPDQVHVMVEGRIVRSGGPELAEELEARGYDFVLK